MSSIEISSYPTVKGTQGFLCPPAHDLTSGWEGEVSGGPAETRTKRTERTHSGYFNTKTLCSNCGGLANNTRLDHCIYSTAAISLSALVVQAYEKSLLSRKVQITTFPLGKAGLSWHSMGLSSGLQGPPILPAGLAPFPRFPEQALGPAQS